MIERLKIISAMIIVAFSVVFFVYCAYQVGEYNRAHPQQVEEQSGSKGLVVGWLIRGLFKR